MLDAAVEFDDPLLGAGFLALEALSRHDEPLQPGGGAGLGFSQARQHRGEIGLARRGLCLFSGARRDDANRFVLGAAGLGDFALRRDPAQMEEQGFGAADLAGNIAVAHRLARLGLQRGDLPGQLTDHVLGPRQILLGSLEPQLGFMASRMEAGNTGCFFQHAAALIGAGLDDLADATLMHQRRRARPGRGVGEQHGDVAGAHFAAVDPERRAVFPHDAAGDFERVVFVERGRRLAVAVVDRDGHFGMIARRTAGIAGKDHVVHLGGAHCLVRGFAHHPADGLHQIGFAAAVRPDNAGQARFNLEIGRFDEGFESGQAQPRELHSLGRSFSPPRRCRESLKVRAKSFCLNGLARWRGGCRIGAENESSGLRAQHAPSIYPDFPVRRALGASRATLATIAGSSGKTLILS